jgi:hypothetical protein
MTTRRYLIIDWRAATIEDVEKVSAKDVERLNMGACEIVEWMTDRYLRMIPIEPDPEPDPEKQVWEAL